MGDNQIFFDLVRECQVTEVVTFFQEAGADITQGDLLALQRVDCIDYFGKLKGPIFFNRLAKLKEKLHSLANPTPAPAAPAPAPAPKPTPAPAPAPTPAAAPQDDGWGGDDWGAPTPAAPVEVKAEPKESSSGFGGGDDFGGDDDFGAGEGEVVGPPPDVYGIRDVYDNKKRAKCFQFSKGLCTRGEKCKFVHDGLETDGSKGLYNFDLERGVIKKGPCFSFASGECHRGAACMFSHDANITIPRCGEFFKNEPNGCSRGDNCRFSHDPNAPEAERRSGGGGNECYAFQKGECQEGDNCRFAHPGVHDGKAPEKSEEECGQWKRGNCDRGDRCRFQHVGEAGEGGGGGGGGGPCRAFAAGNCTYENCRFSHDGEGGEGGADAGAPAPASNEWGAPAADEWGAPAPAAAAAPVADEWGAPAPAPAPVADEWGAPAPAPTASVSQADFVKAVEEDDLAVVKSALAANKSWANTQIDGEFPLSLVVSVNMATLLLDAGANANAVNEDTGETPLCGVTIPALVPLFVSRGADLNIKNVDGQTALDIFEEEDNVAMVDAIKAALAAAAAPAADQKDIFALVEDDDLEGVKSAVAADPNIVNSTQEGDVPLSLAASVAVAEVLLAAGANVNAINDETGETPLMAISSPELAALFISHGADVNIKNGEGKTAVEIFEEDENMEMMEAVRAATAPAAEEKVDFVALVEEDLVDKASAFLAVNPSAANTPTDGDYPLALATSIEMATLLLNNGADVNAKNDEGETPVFGISNPTLVALFVSRGADLNVKNASGETAVQIFTDDENAEMVKALVDAGAIQGADEPDSEGEH